MSTLKQIWQALVAALGQFFAAYSWIEIVEEKKDRLVLSVNTRHVIADNVSRLVSAAGRSVASFEAIQSVEVQHCRNGKRLEWWVVSLHLLGGRRLRIGRTADEVQASIVAAHLSTILGKGVLAVASSLER